jgi:hypothetical protein
LVAVVVVAALAASACGDSPGSSSSATAGAGAAGTPKTSSSRPVQFAQCMRAHGLANFPDPTAEGTFDLPASLTSSPQFASADRSCRSLAPAGSLSGQGPTTQQLDKTVKFVGCMRRHGEPGFPDPLPDGKFDLHGGPNPVDPSAPQFKSAMTACRALLPQGTGLLGTGG